MNILKKVELHIQELKLLFEQSNDDTKNSTLNSLKDLFEELENCEGELLTKLKNEKFLLKQKNAIIDEYIFMTTSDKSGSIVEVSQAYLDFTGFTKEEIVGKNHSIFRNHDMDKKIIKNLWDTILQDKVWEGNLKNNKSTGEEYWIHTIIKPLYDINNVKIGYTSIKEDITTKKRLEEISTKDDLTMLNNRKHFDYSIKQKLSKANSEHEFIALVNIEVDYYHEYQQINGTTKAHKLLISISNMLADNTKDTKHEIFRLSEFEFAIVILNQSDLYIKNFTDTIVMETKKLKIINAESKTSKYVTLSIGIANVDTKIYNISTNDFYNIANANLAKAQTNGGNNIEAGINKEYVKNLKNIDNITKLPNRSALVNDLSNIKDDAMLILLHINQLNSLKDLYGFEFASNVISKKANELKNILNYKETHLYNLNLQEFAILITNKNLFDKYFLLLKHSILMSNDSEENDYDNYLLSDFTAGIAYGIQNIFNHADLVLQEAIISQVKYKSYKTNLSAKQLQEDNLNRLKVYKNALHTGKIVPYFQPIVDTKDDSITKYEALARIETEHGKVVSPYYFLDSAKEDKTFEYFTRQMMQKVFNIFSKNDVQISFNLTYENISSETMVDYIKNRLDQFGGDGITFEILESEDILNYDIIENFITMVKTYGCKISIDDFGSGYSNFTNIIKLDIDYIKLDGSLIQKLNTDDNVKHMISGLLVYAKNSKLKTIAEFVSSQELADTVKELGIDYIQGYHYGEPKPPEYYGLKC